LYSLRKEFRILVFIWYLKFGNQKKYDTWNFLNLFLITYFMKSIHYKKFFKLIIQTMCCRSDSKLEFGVQNHVCWKTQNRRPICGVRGPILTAFGRLPVLEKSAPDLVKSGPDFACSIFQKRIFMGPDLFQFYGSYFYYKYRHCIGVNLEIEGAETRV
jgi:hypothetical protein